MISSDDMKPISPRVAMACSSAEHVSFGVPIPKVIRVATFSPDDWECFVEEWATSLEDTYVHVARFGGSGDLGVDVVGFVSDRTFNGGWENYQCKRYENPLRPSDIWVEIGKIVYYSFKDEYPPPRKHLFVASRDVGTSLQKLLGDPEKLKEQTKANWGKHCMGEITSTASIPLEGVLLDYFERFDFSIFSAKSVVELIAGHAKTSFHSVRFGGGLPPRPAAAEPPSEHEAIESRYIQQLFEAYEDHLGRSVHKVSDLSAEPKLARDFLRQRERFYHAESLRNFARDTVPEGTFERLQDEIYYSVIDTCEADHHDGFERMRATVAQAAQLPTTSNPLASVILVQDRQGVCHQLANADRLSWVFKDHEV
ncbi:MAG TPA: hypothetical protein PLM79_15765 [Syntrophobacteraceae bacterium]|nr:hypothetical protein [Syntrophobacteraceae bacterium]